MLVCLQDQMSSCTARPSNEGGPDAAALICSGLPTAAHTLRTHLQQDADNPTTQVRLYASLLRSDAAAESLVHRAHLLLGGRNLRDLQRDGLVYAPALLAAALVCQGSCCLLFTRACHDKSANAPA